MQFESFNEIEAFPGKSTKYIRKPLFVQAWKSSNYYHEHPLGPSNHSVLLERKMDLITKNGHYRKIPHCAVFTKFTKFGL